MATSTERIRQLRAERRANGLCQACGLAPPAEGRAACEQCLEDQRVRAAAYRRKLPKCDRCGNSLPKEEITVVSRHRKRFKVLPCEVCAARRRARTAGGYRIG